MNRFLSSFDITYKALYIFRLVYSLFIIICLVLVILVAKSDLERIKLDTATDFSSKVQYLESTIDQVETLASIISHAMAYKIDYAYENQDFNMLEYFQNTDGYYSLRFFDDEYKSGLHTLPPSDKEQHNRLKLLLQTGAHLPHILQEEKIERILVYNHSPNAVLTYPDIKEHSKSNIQKLLNQDAWQYFWSIHQKENIHWKLVEHDGIKKLVLSVSILAPSEGLVGMVQFIFSHDIFEQDLYLNSGPDSLVFLSEMSEDELLISWTKAENEKATFNKNFDMKVGKKLPDEIQTLLQSADGWLLNSDEYFLLAVPISSAFNLVYLTDANELSLPSSSVLKYGVALVLFLVFTALFFERMFYRNLTALKRKDDALIEKNHLLTSTLNTLEETQQELIQKEKIASLGGVVAGLAHQLNTPLGVIVTAVSYINEATDKMLAKTKSGLKRSELQSYFENTKESAKLISSNLARSSSLVENFKLLASDESEDELTRFNIVEYTNAVLTGFRPTLEGNRIKSSVQAADDIELYNYPLAYTQVVVQLINNALVHGLSSSGNILIEIEANSLKNCVFINITDDGKGIAKEQIDHIFEPFFTSECATEKIGLGLTITYNLVVGKMKGEIKVRSETGKGCCFSLVLPNLN